MRPEKTISVFASLLFSLVLLLSISSEALSAFSDTLYGIVCRGEKAGYLVEIDMSTGDATPVGDTGLSSPCVLAYNSQTDILLTSNCFGYPPQGFAIDRNTGQTSLTIEFLSINDELVFGDDVLYAVYQGVGTSLLDKLNPETGEWIESVGVINKGPAVEIAISPMTGVMYGTGMSGLNGNMWLFTVNTTPGPPPRETDVVQVDRVFSGLSFSSSGILYATDGTNLLTVNRQTGETTVIGPFGPDIGFVSDIAIVPGNREYIGVRPSIRSEIEDIGRFDVIAHLLKEHLPWCPPGNPACPGNWLSIDIRKTDIPSHMLMLGKAVEKISRAHSFAESFESSLEELKEVIKSIPKGVHFDKETREKLINSINSVIRQRQERAYNEFLKSDILIRSLNAIDLDWRMPELRKQKVDKGKYVGIDLSGMVWVGLRDVVKPGEINLNIKSRYEVFPVGSKYSPTWPFLSYTVDFDGELGSQGFIDLTFYIKPLNFKNKVPAIRVLQLDEGGLIDVTTGKDLSRGTVMARTNHPGTFIILGKD